MAATIKKIQAPNHEAAVFDVSGSPDENLTVSLCESGGGCGNHKCRSDD